MASSSTWAATCEKKDPQVKATEGKHTCVSLGNNTKLMMKFAKVSNAVPRPTRNEARETVVFTHCVTHEAHDQQERRHSCWKDETLIRTRRDNCMRLMTSQKKKGTRKWFTGRYLNFTISGHYCYFKVFLFTSLVIFNFPFFILFLFTSYLLSLFWASYQLIITYPSPLFSTSFSPLNLRATLLFTPVVSTSFTGPNLIFFSHTAFSFIRNHLRPQIIPVCYCYPFNHCGTYVFLPSAQTPSAVP